MINKGDRDESGSVPRHDSLRGPPSHHEKMALCAECEAKRKGGERKEATR